MVDIDSRILRKAAQKLHSQMGNISDFPIEFCNSIANIFYINEYILAYGDQGILNLTNYWVKNENFTKDQIFKYLSIIQSTVYCSSDLAKSLNDHNISINDRNYFIQLTLDQIKYNIPKSIYKSLFRRIIERFFCHPFPEHKDIWHLMSVMQN